MFSLVNFSSIKNILFIVQCCFCYSIRTGISGYDGVYVADIGKDSLAQQVGLKVNTNFFKNYLFYINIR